MDTITVNGLIAFLSPLIGVGGGIWVAMKYISKIEQKADVEYVKTEFLKMESVLNSKIDKLASEKKLIEQQIVHNKESLDKAIEQIRFDLKDGIKDMKDAMQENISIIERLIEKGNNK
jgi:hypothetical protein